MLNDEPALTIGGVDTAENEPNVNVRYKAGTFHLIAKAQARRGSGSRSTRRSRTDSAALTNLKSTPERACVCVCVCAVCSLEPDAVASCRPCNRRTPMSHIYKPFSKCLVQLQDFVAVTTTEMRGLFHFCLTMRV